MLMYNINCISAMATQQDRPQSKIEFMRLLAEAGLSDFLVLKKETADEVLTDRRLELLERIRDEGDESVTELAASLGRDKAAVSRDLSVLFEHSLIDFEHEGQRKIPVVWHETVVIEPIL